MQDTAKGIPSLVVVIVAMLLAAAGMAAFIVYGPPLDRDLSSYPAVDLYVMSFCPYGVQAETAMLPVVELFGSRLPARVHYIASVGGSTADTVESLHGPVEVQEDLRQLCVQTLYPDAFWPYLDDFNARCFQYARNGTLLDRCWREVAAMNGIDQGRIQTCAEGAEGMDLLRNDDRIFGRDWITGSPTLLVDGTVYTGQRTPEAFKLAICANMTDRPASCDTRLSTQSGAAGSCS